MALTPGTTRASKDNLTHSLRLERWFIDLITKRVFRPDRSCSEQTVKTSNPSLNSTSAPSKHSTHRKGTPFLVAASSTGSLTVSSYGNEYLTSAFPSLLSMKSSSSAISKTWRAPSRNPSSAAIELRPAQVHTAPWQMAHESRKELQAGLRRRPVPPTVVFRYGHDTLSGHAMLEVEKHEFEQMSGVGCTAGDRGGVDGMETRGPQPTQSGT